MNLVNNFRYGEISRKTAGRFDTEAYQQGAFLFRNMVSHTEGDASRRPPIRKLADVADNTICMRKFMISESLSYIVCICSDRIDIYRKVLGTMKKVSELKYPESIKEISEYKAYRIRTAQYYTRMYFVHSSFRPFYIEQVSLDTFSISEMKILLNQDAKDYFWFTPSYIEDIEGNEMTALEGRIVYRNGNKWYFDRDSTEEYIYANTYPPVKGESTYISGYDSFNDDLLLSGPGNYPSVISIINDSIFLAATDNEPQTIWKSRVLGSSQYIEGYSADTMHDFIRFQSITTESVDLVEEENLPMTALVDSSGAIIYEQYNGIDAWYMPEKDSNGNYTYSTMLYWRPYEFEFFTDEDKKYKYDISEGYPVTRDGGFTWYKPEKNDEGVYLWKTKLYYNKVSVEGGQKYFYDQSYSSPYDMALGTPVRKPMMTYDFSNPDALLRKKVNVDFVANDSCGVRMSFNSGKNDRITGITASCGKIIVNTTTSEFVLPSSFSAVNNLQSEMFSSHGSIADYAVQQISMDGSFFFIQRDNIIREFYLYEGYMMRNDVTSMNHSILDGSIIQAESKNTPEPMIYFVMEDGTMRTVAYDRVNGLQSFSRWDIASGYRIVSVSEYDDSNKPIMAVLVASDSGKFIGFFDENESESFIDDISGEYISEIETTYVEIYDQSLGFGRFKKANRATIRPFNTGYVMIGSDYEQVTRTNYRLGCDDYSVMLLSTAKHQYSLRIMSYGSDPMDILAFGFEMAR